MELENLQKGIDEVLNEISILEGVGKENTELYLTLMDYLRVKIEKLKYYLEEKRWV